MKTALRQARKILEHIERRCGCSTQLTHASVMAADLVRVLQEHEACAGRAYTAYCAAVGGKAFNGDPLPDWETFRADPAKKKQSDAWVEAVKVI
jgi:hypothetical protein